MTNKWEKKFKGNQNGGAWIYTHPDTFESRAVVHNHNGYSFNGVFFDSLKEAKDYALRKEQNRIKRLMSGIVAE